MTKSARFGGGGLHGSAGEAELGCNNGSPSPGNLRRACVNCGNEWTQEELEAERKKRGILSCCPERQMSYFVLFPTRWR